MSKDDGGSAFPIPEIADGMTLRDYFAAKALDGLMSGRWKADVYGNTRDVYTADAIEWAKNAYVFADAMLEARKK